MKKLSFFCLLSLVFTHTTRAVEWHYSTTGIDAQDSYRSQINCRISNFNAEVALQLKEHFQQADNPKLASACHCPALVPSAQDFKKYIEKNIKLNPQLNKLIKEIDYKVEAEEVSPHWLYTLALRFQAAISTVSEEEKELIRNSVNPGAAYMDGLANSEHWTSENKTVAVIKTFPKNENFNYINAVLAAPENNNFKNSQIVVEKITALLKKAVPKIEFPILTQGVFPLDFLLKANLNDIYPVGMPLKTRHVHGTPFSPLSFFVHDDLHKVVDPKLGALIEYTYDLAQKGYSSGLEHTDLLVEAATNNAVRKYHLLTQTLENILEALREDKKALAGMFYILHESPRSFDKSSLEGNDISAVIMHLTGKTIERLQKAPSNLLKTSPFDGKSSLTDIEITNLVKKEEFQKYARAFVGAPLPLKEEAIKTITIKKGPRFYNLQTITPQETVIDYVVPTLAYEWNAVDDHYKLLNHAGYALTKPTLDQDNLEQASKTVLDDMSRISGLLSECVEHFEKMALSYIQESTLKTYYPEKSSYINAAFERDVFFKIKKQ